MISQPLLVKACPCSGCKLVPAEPEEARASGGPGGGCGMVAVRTHALSKRGVLHSFLKLHRAPTIRHPVLLDRQWARLSGPQREALSSPKAGTKECVASVLRSHRNGRWETGDIAFQMLWKPGEPVSGRPLLEGISSLCWLENGGLLRG